MAGFLMIPTFKHISKSRIKTIYVTIYRMVSASDYRVVKGH